MKTRRHWAAWVAFLAAASLVNIASAANTGLPQLVKQGTATQLAVDGAPFLILGGELLNSSSSSPEYMKPIWDRLTEMHLNTVLAAVSWELTEPEEGKFDFTILDRLVQDARSHQLKLVLLWFGSWKNGMSSYAPVWVKRDLNRFPRVQLKNGEMPEVLTPLSMTTADADARAFAAMMKHLRDIDGREHTVLMVQVENEVGVLGDSRDRSPVAETAFRGAVPSEWFDYVEKRGADLVPEFRALWEAAGAKRAGTWTEVFGSSATTDEIFMAWHYARYVDRVAAAGVAAYPIPCYVNAWLNEKDAKPGDYPSGGPLAHLINVWQAGAPHISLIGPDLYASNFEGRCQAFTRSGNALFIPETVRGAKAPANVFTAVGRYNATGFSPFAIDAPHFGPPPASAASTPGRFPAPEPTLGRAYEVLAQIAPMVLQHQGSDRIVGFSVDEDHPSFVTTIGGVEVEISRDEVFGRRAEKGFGLIMAVGRDEFIGAGSGFRVIFRPSGATRIGIGSVDEGVFRDGKWIKGRRLNGDEDDQGRAWRFASFDIQIERCTFYRYQ